MPSAKGLQHTDIITESVGVMFIRFHITQGSQT